MSVSGKVVIEVAIIAFVMERDNLQRTAYFCEKHKKCYGGGAESKQSKIPVPGTLAGNDVDN